MNTQNVINRTYLLASGLEFKVLSIKSYPAKKITKQYESILSIKPGHLAAISFRGIMIPNITLEGGEVRLISIKVDGVVFDKPGVISKVLGLKNHTDYFFVKKVN